MNDREFAGIEPKYYGWKLVGFWALAALVIIAGWAVLWLAYAGAQCLFAL